MKTTRFLMMFVAAATMLFASCGKDDESNTPTEAAANTMVQNGKVYQMTSTYKYEQSGRVYIDAHAVDMQDGRPIFSIISDNPGNGTYDLSQHAVFFAMTPEVDYLTGFYSESSYKSGSVTIEKDDNAFRMKMSGTMDDGTTVAFHIYVPASEWQQLEW